MSIIDFLSQPWHWSISGIMIVVVMFLLMYLGQRFGISTSFQAMCSAAGAGKSCSYFDYNWKSQAWLLWFVVGSIVGGGIASSFIADPNVLDLSSSTVADLSALGIAAPSGDLYPTDLFSIHSIMTPAGFILFVLGGFLIGFGTRYAGGCTSGHAISGLSDLQLPSLVAVVGFFIGGLLMTHLLFPIIFNL